MGVILMTGATGFLGSRLAARLAGGHDLVLLKRSASDTGRLGRLARELPIYDLDRDGLNEALAAHPVEVVIHTATDYGRSGAIEPVLTANLVLPVSVAAAAAAAGARAFLNADTVLPRFLNPYALAKAQLKEWLRLMGARLASVNLALQSFYGPGEGAEAFVSSTLLGLMAGGSELPFTPGDQARDFIYIDDVVEAFALVVERLDELGPGQHEVQVGSGRALSIRQFVALAKELTHSAVDPEFGAKPYRPEEPMRCCADVSRLETWGWRARVDLAEGLTRTIAHLRGPAGGGA
ncbi:MAG: NAD(P)-dependent oxidoreductase [Pseudomonadota bacterium]